MGSTQISSSKIFGGTQRTLEHESAATGRPMRLAVFTPERPSGAGLVFLSGLSCTEENFTVKAGAQRLAADLGLTLIAPDTSPRGVGVADDAAYDLGQGAGFYIDATQAPWAEHFQMESYIVQDLLAVVHGELGIERGRLGLSGHSMGGHGALTLGLKYPDKFVSVSAFAPIVAPSLVPWGRKAFTAYLGVGADWRTHCATALIEDGARHPRALLIDQGAADPFLQDQLQIWRFEQACQAANQPARFAMRPGYDHSYFYIASFIDEHLRWHAQQL